MLPNEKCYVNEKNISMTEYLNKFLLIDHYFIIKNDNFS